MMQEQPLKFYKTKSNKMITKKTLLTDTKTRNSIIYEVITSVLSYKVTLKYHENTVQLGHSDLLYHKSQQNQFHCSNLKIAHGFI